MSFASIRVHSPLSFPNVHSEYAPNLMSFAFTFRAVAPQREGGFALKFPDSTDCPNRPEAQALVRICRRWRITLNTAIAVHAPSMPQTPATGMGSTTLTVTTLEVTVVTPSVASHQ